LRGKLGDGRGLSHTRRADEYLDAGKRFSPGRDLRQTRRQDVQQEALRRVAAHTWRQRGGDLGGKSPVQAGRLQPGKVGVISGASGTAPATAEERAFLAEHADIAVRATGSYLGHAFEPQFLMNVAIAAIAVSRGNLYPPADDSGVERAIPGPMTQAVVTSVGHWRGEGLALVEAEP